MMENETFKIEGYNKQDARITAEQRMLFNILVKDKLDDWRTYSKRTNIGIWKSVIEKYPETAHFIYELIQNADDALATEVMIFLFKDKLVFKHNGKRQFSITDAREQYGKIGDINSITSVACSTKKDEERTIGKFGVGFKSVFQYTDVPYIYDDTFWFKIENFMVPTLLDSDNKFRREGETLFEIPFKNPEKAYSEILDRLQHLNMPTLFLPHVKSITWKIDSLDEVHEYSQEVLQSNERYGIKYELCRIHDYEQSQLLYLFHRDYTTSEGIYNIGVGYFLNSDGSLDVQTTRNIYCFFPTSETFDSCFVSHAPFLVIDNRDRIKDSENINKEFLHGIEELAADALLCLRDIGLCRNSHLLEEKKESMISKPNLLLTDNLFHILNIESISERSVALKQCFLDKVKGECLILNRSLRYVSHKEVYSTTKELDNLLSSSQLQQLYKDENKDFVYLKQYRADFKEEMRNFLSISAFDNKLLACVLTSSFMKNQPIEWTDRLLTYIEENAIKLWKTNGDTVRNCYKSYYSSDSWSDLKFRFAPIVKTEEGEWIAPYTLYKKEANVCLPYEGFKDAGENAFGKVIDNELFKKHEPFFRSIGLKEPGIADYIEKTLLVRYEDSSRLSEEVLIKDFKLIFKLLHEQSNVRLKDILKRKWKLKSMIEIENSLYKIAELNIPSDNFLAFAKGNSTFKFVDCNFYAEGTGLSCNEVKNFLIWRFEIPDTPKIKKIPICAQKLFRRVHYTYSYKNMPQQVVDFLDNQNLAITKEPSFDDFQLEGYDIENCSYEWSHAYWKIILKNGLNSYAKGKLIYYLYNEKGDYHDADIESTVLANLKFDKWIVRQDGTFCTPSEITTEEFHLLGYETNKSVEVELDFLDKIQAELIREERAKKKEEEMSKRKDLLQQLNEINCPVEQLESFVTALQKGIDINKMIEGSLSINPSYEKYLDPSLIDNNKSCVTNDMPSVIASNIEPLSEIANTVGEANLPYVAENIDSFMDWLDDEDKLPSMVRRIVNYIGKKIYEQYLIDAGVEYEVINDGDSCGDFNIGNGEKYVSVISTLKTIADNRIPVGITAVQNVFLRSHPDAQIRIVRISLKDIMVLPQYERIVAIFGKEENPNVNDRLRKQCDELAVNYWKGADIAEFDTASPEYSIKIERKYRK